MRHQKECMSPRQPRATLAASCFIHFLHDGCSDLLYLLFPVWAREFSLSFAQVGLLRTGYSGALALFQIPAGFLAEGWGEPRVLAAGTLITAILLAELLFGALLSQVTGKSGDLSSAVVNSVGNVKAVGALLYGQYLFPFEIASILLLVGIVGAVVISKRK